MRMKAYRMLLSAGELSGIKRCVSNITFKASSCLFHGFAVPDLINPLVGRDDFLAMGDDDDGGAILSGHPSVPPAL